MLQTCFNPHNIYFLTLNIPFKGTTNAAISMIFKHRVGANVLAKKSKIVVLVNLNSTNKNTLPTERAVTKTMKLKIIVNVFG